MSAILNPLPDVEAEAEWARSAERLQSLWRDFLQGEAAQLAGELNPAVVPVWKLFAANLISLMSLVSPDKLQGMWDESLAKWQQKAGQDGGAYMQGDRRFADTAWHVQPFFVHLRQTYQMLAEQLRMLAGDSDPVRRDQLRFITDIVIDALSPTNFAATNPVVLNRAIETKGASLVKGLEHLLSDIKRGQITHSDPARFRLGETVAETPGKVIHQTPLYQLIQYSPVTELVLATPLVIFPPWINRYYILDLGPTKSFVRWATEQGITVFMVSWKSADVTMADVVWDDYIAAQIEAADVIRERLSVPSVHTIGYCVAGTTLAATLAIAARRGEAERFKSATFFTAQVDFSEAGDLSHFITDASIASISALAPLGYLDGRYMAAVFNLLRGRNLIWNPAIKHYLLGEDYPAFDMLHWNGDVTNLPARWHESYLRDLYRDNRLVSADSLSALGTPIDLRQIATPSYIQAGREDHIAPPGSVWKLTEYLAGPWTFVLAGSGHIAGVVNHPSSGKYQHWTNPDETGSLAAFTAGAQEHRGSWWPHWSNWLRALDSAEVTANGKRNPGGESDPAIEDAPGSFVRMR
jgi:polyhydroxyalkanoate synthase